MYSKIDHIVFACGPMATIEGRK